MKLKSLIDLLKEDIDFHSNGNKKIITYLFDQRARLLRWYRISYFLKDSWLSPLTILYNNLILFFFNSELSNNASIGRKVKFAHPLGIVIGNNVEIGDNCIIYQNVTLGAKGGKNIQKKYPKVGNNVIIYPNSVIIGGITLGNNSIIGACSLVLKDVTPNTMVGGVPSKLLK